MVTAIPDEQIRALLVFPNLDRALEIRSLLTKTDAEMFVLYRAERAGEAIRRVSNDEYHVVITDLDLPDSSCPELISGIRKTSPHIPIVVVSDREDVDAGLKVVQSGAQEYIERRLLNPGLLLRLVRFAIERARQSRALASISSHQIELKDQFLSQFSHELRSPITAIYQFITILMDGLAGELTQEQRDYLEISLRNVNLMRDMVRDLMDVTRAQTGKLTIRPRCTSVVTMISETIVALQTTAKARNITLAPVDLRYVPPIMADPGRIHQVLNNLCDNALKFCRAGDTISLAARVFEQDSEFVCISVGDTGCGISKEGRQQVFEYLYQDEAGLNYNHKGLGIGLAICKELVTQHGGHIWVESEPGIGSLFSFLLPRFRLLDVMSPLISIRDAAANRTYLLTIEVRNGPKAAAPLSESTRQRIWECLERSSRSGCEVTLPRMSSSPERELIFVVTNSFEGNTEQQVIGRLMKDAQIDDSLVELRISTQSLTMSRTNCDKADQHVDTNNYTDIECAIKSLAQR
jgi:signal transduction histidine kinase